MSSVSALAAPLFQTLDQKERHHAAPEIGDDRSRPSDVITTR